MIFKPSLRVDLHSHTTRYSGCSRVEPEKAVALAAKRGLDVLVITEHHRRWQEDELAPLRRLAPGLTVLSGMEVSLQEGFDVVLLGGDVPRTMVPLQKAAKLAEAMKGWGPHFAFVAHPFRHQDKIDRRLKAVLGIVHGIEMLSCNILKPGAVRTADGFVSDVAHMYDKARDEWNLRPVFASDSHTEPAIGAVATELRTKERIGSIDDLVAALCTAEASAYQDSDLVAEVLTFTGFGWVDG